MKKYNCILVDDEPLAIELLSDMLDTFYADKIHIAGTYTHWSKAVEVLRAEEYDILFLDISMQGHNSIDLVKAMPAIQSEIIFITAHTNYAVEAFKITATGYIVKPIDELEFTRTVDKAIDRIKNKKLATQRNRVSSKIGIPGNGAIDYIDPNEILYLSTFNKCTILKTTAADITSSYNIGKFRDILDENIFRQVHRSYMVNINHVSKYKTEGIIIMKNGDEVPVSKNEREAFLNLFNRVNNSNL